MTCFWEVSDISNSYRLYNPISKKIITRKYIVLAENGRWIWNEENKFECVELDINENEVDTSDKIEEGTTQASD